MGGTAEVPSEAGMLPTAWDRNLACTQPQQFSQYAWLARPDPAPPPTTPHVPGCSRRRAANTLAAPCRWAWGRPAGTGRPALGSSSSAGPVAGKQVEQKGGSFKLSWEAGGG